MELLNVAAMQGSCPVLSDEGAAVVFGSCIERTVAKDGNISEKIQSEPAPPAAFEPQAPPPPPPQSLKDLDPPNAFAALKPLSL